MSDPRRVDWRTLSDERPATYRSARNLVLAANGTLFLLGVVTINLTSGLALAVAAALFGAWLVAVIAGLVYLSRQRMRERVQGLLAGAVGALAGEVLLGAVLLFGWLANNYN
ncbi:hypothetical protein G6553_07010 [Nocardioides sp. IC4_145]|uniref:hypothetical protein n=1 Tax=Nocardioides sp. IC4_145 TaxID=2714037 RepID=UPI001407FE39|nr:hypothetical protein [Nocardioides sp. IC4_145]NHC22920.1 hypothetical protein [Nocardioides sp. IC4_145]